ncbi:MAG: GtrA family protein [bacterium]
MLSKLVKKQFICFLFIGGINTLFGYGFFSLFLFLGLHYSIAALFGTILGILFNFKTTGIFVFRSHNNLLIYKFFAVYVAIYFFNVVGLYLFDMVYIRAYVAGAILILPMACLSFVLNKKFVFKSDASY